MILADLGAEVIRLSRKSQKGEENKYDIHNRSKLSITADLKNKDTIQEILKLISFKLSFKSCLLAFVSRLFTS